MNETTEPPAGGEGRGGNLILLAGFAAIVGIGLWLVVSLDQHRKLDNCLTQGRRDCEPAQALPTR